MGQKEVEKAFAVTVPNSVSSLKQSITSFSSLKRHALTHINIYTDYIYMHIISKNHSNIENTHILSLSLFVFSVDGNVRVVPKGYWMLNPDYEDGTSTFFFSALVTIHLNFKS